MERRTRPLHPYCDLSVVIVVHDNLRPFTPRLSIDLHAVFYEFSANK